MVCASTKLRPTRVNAARRGCRPVMCCSQAGDGRRDWSVTGVQTCALRISSRRRHTRLVSDWSSDVCSSDLSGVYIGSATAFIVGGLVIQATSQAGEVVFPLLGSFKPWQAAFIFVALPGIALVEIGRASCRGRV